MTTRHNKPCVHHWVLSAPRLTTVHGVCRRCGARRVFPSGFEIPDVVQYEELDRSSPPPSLEPASLEAHSLA